MTIKIENLIAELLTHAPIGVDVPRKSDSNDVDGDIIARWAGDAAQQINDRRGKSTLKETIITLVLDQTDYALPSDARIVTVIDRKHGTVQSSILGIPSRGGSFGLGAFGVLPNGQEITPALDNINRSRLSIVEDEDDYEMFAGNIRFLFPIEPGLEVKVKYTAVDRLFSDLGDDRFTMILDYLVLQNLDWWLGKHGTTMAQDGDSFGGDTTPVLFRRKRELEDKWISGLNAIGPEAN